MIVTMKIWSHWLHLRSSSRLQPYVQLVTTKNHHDHDYRLPFSCVSVTSWLQHVQQQEESSCLTQPFRCRGRDIPGEPCQYHDLGCPCQAISIISSHDIDYAKWEYSCLPCKWNITTNERSNVEKWKWIFYRSIVALEARGPSDITVTRQSAR